MIRLRVSDLDQWLRYSQPEREEFEVSTADFLSYMRREEEANEAMKAGTAFHSLLEHAEINDEWDEERGVERDGFTFRFTLDQDLSLPPVREPEVMEVAISTSFGPVLLRGRIDGREFGTVIDWKLTERFDAERYGKSMQWKAYLMMDPSARRFQYRVFQSRRKGSVVWVNDYHALDFYPYSGMAEEVSRVAGELALFVHGNLSDAAHLFQSEAA